MKYFFTFLILILSISCSNTSTENKDCKNQCDFKGVFCEGDEVYNCDINSNACLEKSKVKSCLDGETCNLGECQNLNCENECFAVGVTCSSDKNKIVYCNNYDSDICLDREEVECNTEIEECVNGTCTIKDIGCEPENNTCGDGVECLENQDNQYICTCESGYTYDAVNKSCKDIDECEDETDTCSENSICVNTIGAFDCECKSGFYDDNGVCRDVDECLVNHGCNQICNNTVGSFECLCNDGYALSDDAKTCEDIDECLTDNGACDENAQCSNSEGSFSCSCKFGFEGDGITCTDIDECLVNNGDCGDLNYITCTNNVGSAPTCTDIDECLINNGGCGDANYTKCNNNFASAQTCSDINECLIDNGGCGNASYTTCTNNVGSAQTCADINECLINNGGCGNASYITCNNNNGSAQTCTDINECLINNGGCGNAAFTTCTNNNGAIQTCSDINECLVDNGGCGSATAFNCLNNIGASPTCSDVDECIENTDNCDENATCTNNYGSFSCACKTGYTGNGVTCTDINECLNNADNNCHANANCTNTPGSYTCACNTGYSGNGVSCSDINECNLGTDNCDVNANCTNTIGSYTCACNAGYTGNGVTCTDVNECLSNDDNNCHANANCTNTPGSYTCDCNTGYTGDGVNCSDINECNLGTDNCDVNANCTNTSGSYTCACKSGFTGNGLTCSDINECLSNNGNCDQYCTNTIGSFNCSCIAGWTLENDDLSCICDNNGSDVQEICDGIDNNCDEVIDENPYAICTDSDNNSVCIEGNCSFIGADKIYSGRDHSCLITDGANPELYCWGRNNENQVSVSDSTNPIKTPLKVNLGAWIPISVSLGDNHTCVIVRDNTNTDFTGDIVVDEDEVVCWGKNTKGQLGIDNHNSNTSLAHVMLDGLFADNSYGASKETIKGAFKLVVGVEHSCVLLNTGKIFCWGRNDERQLGDCETTDSNTAHQIKVACPSTYLEYAVDISSGDKHICTILANDNGDTNTVRCWGNDEKSQLGDNSNTGNKNYATNVKYANNNNIQGYNKITSGKEYTCGFRNSNNRTYCWGNNTEKAFNNTVNEYDTPMLYNTSNLILVNTSMSSEYLCYIGVNDSNLRCQGYNKFNQISTSSNDPIGITTITDMTVDIDTTGYTSNDVSIGESHTCYLTTNPIDNTRNIVRCKGGNANCQLGVTKGTCDDISEFDFVKK